MFVSEISQKNISTCMHHDALLPSMTAFNKSASVGMYSIFIEFKKIYSYSWCCGRVMSGATFCQSCGDVCQWRWKDRVNKVCTCGKKTVCDLVETVEGVYHIPHVLRPHRSAAARRTGTVVA